MAFHSPTDSLKRRADMFTFYARRAAALGRETAARLAELADAANELARSGR